MTRARELADLLTGGQTIATDDNTAQLTLKSTDADAVVGPVLDLVRDSSSPADDDKVGVVSFKGDDDAGNSVTFAQVRTVLKDVTDTAEDGELQLQVRRADSLVTGLFIGQTEAVFNEDGQNVDFRVESDTQTHMFFVDADSELVTIGTNIGSLFNAEGTVAALTVAGSDTSTTTIGNGGAAINISNKDGTGGNTAGIHFSREDNDGNPHFSGAAIVAQFPDDQTTGEYPKGRLHFNTSTTANAAPSTKMTLLEDGKLGIGATSPASLLEIKASALNRANGIALVGSGANDILYMYPSADNVATIEHLINGSTSTGGPIHINPQGGDLLLGTTSTIGPAQFNVDGSSQCGIGIRAGNGTSGFFNQVLFANNDNSALIGSIQRVNNASIQYNTTSDERLKENIADMTGAITRVKQLAPKRYSWVNEDLDAADQDGFLAHEAQTVVPGAVSGTQDEVDGDGNPVYMQMDYSKLVPLLTGALKEAIAKIETLETKVAALEAE